MDVSKITPVLRPFFNDVEAYGRKYDNNDINPMRWYIAIIAELSWLELHDIPRDKWLNIVSLIFTEWKLNGITHYEYKTLMLDIAIIIETFVNEREKLPIL